MPAPRRLVGPLLVALAGACAHGPPPLRSTYLVLEEDGYGLRAYVRATVAGWAMTIDLERGELRFDPEAVALERIGRARAEVDYRTCPDEGLFNDIHRVVTAKVNGVRARMLVDTGASRTTLSRNNPAIPSMMEALGSPGAAAGVTSVGQGLLVEDVPVELAGTTFVLSAVVLPAPQSCWQGAVGADLLRHCTMVWGWSSLWLACRSPGRPPAE